MFRIGIVAMAENADWSVPAALLDDPQHGGFMVSLCEGDNQFPLLVAVADHAVDVQAQQIGLHAVERAAKVINVCVAVVEVIDNPHMRRIVMLAEVFANGHEVLRLTAPAIVVVEAKPAAEPAGALDDGQQLGRCSLDLFIASRRFRAGCGQPDLRMQAVLIEQLERFVMDRPEGEVLQFPLLILQNLLLERCDVRFTPVVGDLVEAELGHHLRALGRSALLRIKRHDAPRDQVGPGKELILRGWLGGEGRPNGWH